MGRHGTNPVYLVQCGLDSTETTIEESYRHVEHPPNGTTTILLVRHTDVHNPEDVLYGRLPRFGLSELGRQQAERTALALAEDPVSAIYTSPQLRARQTARAIAGAHPAVPLKITRLLNEVLTGWQGRHHRDLEPIDFDFYSHPLGEDDETIEHLWRRVTHFVARTRKRHPGEMVVAVTHGDICLLARSVYSGLPREVASIRGEHLYPGKGSITRLAFGSDLSRIYPCSVEYCDPNSDRPEWSAGWVRFGPPAGGSRAESQGAAP